MAKYILKAFFLTTFALAQKKCQKIYAVTLVLILKEVFQVCGFEKIDLYLSVFFQKLCFSNWLVIFTAFISTKKNLFVKKFAILKDLHFFLNLVEI